MSNKKFLENMFFKKPAVSILFLVFLIILLLIPSLFSGYIVHVVIMAAIYAILTVSYDLVFGYTGQLTFCQGAFFAIGGYASVLLDTRAGIPFWIALILSILFVFILAVIIGYPVLKLRGSYFAVTTFFMGYFIYLILLNSINLTGGSLGLRNIIPPKIFGINFASMEVCYFFILLILLLVFMFLYKLVNSKFGKYFIAIREDQDLAESIGINTTLNKVLSFAISASIAAIAGVIYAYYILYLNPQDFTWMTSEMIVIMTIVGGAGTLIGPMVGAGLVTAVLEILRFAPEARFVIWAMALILVLVINPGGILGILKSLKRGGSKSEKSIRS